MKTVSDEQVRGFLKLLTMSVNELEFKKRVRVRLKENNISQIWKTIILSREMLDSIPGFGNESRYEFYQKVSELGFDWKTYYYFYNEFWKWTNEVVGYPHKATPEERLRFVSYLHEWPTLEEVTRKLLEEKL